MRRDPASPSAPAPTSISLPIFQACRSRTAILRLASDEMYAATPSGGTSTACGAACTSIVFTSKRVVKSTAPTSLPLIMPAARAPQELERFQKRPQAPRPSLHNIAFSIDDSESGLGLISRESQAV